MKTYLYPQNLKAVAKLWLWSLKDFMAIGVALLISVLALTQTGFAVPVALTLLYGFLTIRIDEATVLDFLKYAAKYFIMTQQYFEWREKYAQNEKKR
ncbi:MAG: hypothetical protein LBO70_04990 [Clostridiales Family XIII bacterium]|jgi:hypothetical protein|nr:hypothetical protein [Clostridiales Family XIII bacterium]